MLQRKINIIAIILFKKCDDLTSALHENRLNEEKYELDKTKTVPLTKDDLNHKIYDEQNQNDLNKTMQIPIVNDSIKQQKFQSSEPRYYQKSDKKRSKMKIAILSIIFVILLIGLFSFVAMAVLEINMKKCLTLKEN